MLGLLLQNFFCQGLQTQMFSGSKQSTSASDGISMEAIGEVETVQNKEVHVLTKCSPIPKCELSLPSKDACDFRLQSVSL